MRYIHTPPPRRPLFKGEAMHLSLLILKNYFKNINTVLEISEHFIFGNDEKSLREQISSFTGMYTFVDFGEVDSSIDKYNCIGDTFSMAITVAFPFGANIVSSDDILLKQDEALTVINRLKKQMRDDQRSIAWLKYLSASNRTIPFVAPDLARSIGWTLTFNLEGADLFGIK